MKTKVNFLKRSDCYAAAVPLAPTGIVVHSTGVDQRRIKAYADQLDRPGVRKCVHGFIGLDEEGVLCFEQHLPYGVRCWGVGSGEKGSYNASHIQLELCEDLSDGDWCRRLWEAALEKCAELCLAFGINAENVVTHKEAHAAGYGSNHADPEHWWSRHGLDPALFRAELKDRLAFEEEYARFKAMLGRYEAERAALAPSDYAAEAAKAAVESGIFSDGDGDGSLDRPQSVLLRQELAAVLQRLGLTESAKEEKE